MEIIAIFLVCIAFFAAVLLAFHFLGDYVYTYRLGTDGVEIVLFRSIRVAVLHYGNLENAEVLSIGALLKANGGQKALHLNIVNRLTRRVVLLERRSGLCRFIAISPRDIDGFTNGVKMHLNEYQR